VLRSGAPSEDVPVTLAASSHIIEDAGWTYRLEAPLGSGGFATVFRATMSRGGVCRRVAVKVLQISASADPEAVARLGDEARILSRLEHHAIVRVLGVIRVEGRLAVVMDLIDGTDLGTLIAEHPLPPRAVCEVGADVASALDAAWSDPDPTTGEPMRVIHRDVKPANILFTRRGAVRLVDFGVARASFDREGTTRSHHQFGTGRYMSPERFDNETTHQSDVFALAVTLVEALTGRKFERMPVRRSHYDAACTDRLRPLLQLDAPVHWNVELMALLEEMLHYESHRRPQATEVAARLLELADEAPGEGARRALPPRIEARMASLVVAPTASLPEPAPRPATGSIDASPTPSVVLPEPEPSPRSSRWLLAAGLAFCCVSMTALAAVWWAGASGPAPVPPMSPPESDAIDVLSSVEDPLIDDLPVQAPPIGEGQPPAAHPRETTSGLESSASSATRPAPTPPAEPSPESTADGLPLRFQLAVGSGGVVVVDAVEHRLPWTGTLSFGLHAVTFRHDGREQNQMIYVGDAAPRTYAFDSSSGVIHGL
jgi:serine/threonine protein kinase